MVKTHDHIGKVTRLSYINQLHWGNEKWNCFVPPTKTLGDHSLYFFYNLVNTLVTCPIITIEYIEVWSD
jgi:hypothetical protein